MKNTAIKLLVIVSPLVLGGCKPMKFFSSVPIPEKPGRITVYNGAYKTRKENSVLPDPCIRNGMNLIYSNPIDWQGHAESGKKYWTCCPWHSINPLQNATQTRVGNATTFKDASHDCTFDNDDGEWKWCINAAAEYKTKEGKDVLAGGNWDHFLISVDSWGEKEVKPAELEAQGKHLYYTFDSRITYLNIEEPEEGVKVNANCAQLLSYFQLRYTDNTRRSDGGYNNPCTLENRYQRWMWVGCPLFDTRYDGQDMPGYAANDDLSPQGTNMYIYTCSTAYYPNYYHKSGVQNSVKLDLIPLFKEALKSAHEHNFMMDTTWENASVGYLNIGYEVPGYVTIGSTIGNLDVYIE